MAFKTTYFTKSHNFNKEEFTEAISKINTATSISGIVYTNIRCDNNLITGIRESTERPFSIKIDSLYKAYKELYVFSTSTLKRYVDRVQSPSMAILIAIGAIVEETLTDEEYAKRQAIKQTTYEDKPGMSNLVKFFIGLTIGGVLIFCGTLGSDKKTIENGHLTEVAYDYAVSSIKQKIDNPSSFKDGSWKESIWDSNSNDRRYVMMLQFTHKNSFGERVHGTAFVYFDVNGNATYYEFL